MKALLCKQYGPPESLTLEEIAPLTPAAGEAIVEVEAASVNFPDLLIIENKYQFKPPLPFSPGSEMAGIVKAVAPDVTRVKPGDRVFGFTGWGAFAEEVRIDASRLFKMPALMPFEHGASLLMGHGTAIYALAHRGQVKPGETLLVLGAAGGVGLAAVELGKMLGARVIACASDQTKLDLCVRHGADEVINYATEDLRARIKQLTGGKGIDVVCDPVGGALTEAAFRSMAWGGRLLVIGFASGTVPSLPLNIALLKGASIVGVFWGDFFVREPAVYESSVQQLLQWYEQGLLQPDVSKTFALEQAAEALASISSRSATGKLVIRTR